MLQQDKPEDFVIAAGVQFSVRSFIDKTAKELGITLAWEGEGVNELGKVTKIEGDKAPAVRVGDVIVKIDPRYFRFRTADRELAFRPADWDLVLRTEPGFNLPFPSEPVEPLVLRSRDEILPAVTARVPGRPEGASSGA